MQSTIWNSIQTDIIHKTLVSQERKQLEVYWCKLILSSDLVPQTKRLSLIRNSDGVAAVVIGDAAKTTGSPSKLA